MVSDAGSIRSSMPEEARICWEPTSSNNQDLAATAGGGAGDWAAAENPINTAHSASRNFIGEVIAKSGRQYNKAGPAHCLQRGRRGSVLELFLEQRVDLLRIGFALGGFHHLPDQRIEGFFLAGAEFFHRFRVGGEHFIDQRFNR